MRHISKAVACSAMLLAFAGGAFAQGSGGSGGAGAGGGSSGQGGAGMGTPNGTGATGTSSGSKGSTMSKSPTRMPQKAPHAKGASDTAASVAQ